MEKFNNNTVRKPAIVRGLLLAVLVASVAAGCGSSKAKVAAPTILRFLSVDKSFVAIGFNEQRAPKVGDRFLFTTSIYKANASSTAPSGKPVGRRETLCTVTAPQGSELLCSGIVYLPGGRLVVTDAVHGESKINTVAIVGGAGAYANARGTAEFTVLKRQSSGVETNAVVVRLLP